MRICTYVYTLTTYNWSRCLNDNLMVWEAEEEKKLNKNKNLLLVFCILSSLSFNFQHTHNVQMLLLHHHSFLLFDKDKEGKFGFFVFFFLSSNQKKKNCQKSLFYSHVLSELWKISIENNSLSVSLSLCGSILFSWCQFFLFKNEQKEKKKTTRDDKGIEKWIIWH